MNRDPGWLANIQLRVSSESLSRTCRRRRRGESSTPATAPGRPGVTLDRYTTDLAATQFSTTTEETTEATTTEETTMRLFIETPAG